MRLGRYQNPIAKARVSDLAFLVPPVASPVLSTALPAVVPHVVVVMVAMDWPLVPTTQRSHRVPHIVPMEHQHNMPLPLDFCCHPWMARYKFVVRTHLPIPNY